MLARMEGRVVFVAGAIPGEESALRVTRETRQAVWADVVDVVTPSPDRRDPPCDPACGGLAYAHIKYERQSLLKSEVIADAFRRLGAITLDAGPVVAPSPEHGYRVRARLHVRGGRAGFFRAGTHDLCDANATGQLLPEALTATDQLCRALAGRTAECDAVVVAENVAASERVLHLEAREGARLDDLARRLALPDGVRGITTGVRGRTIPLAGATSVTDNAAQLFGETPPISNLTAWSRKASSFFQGNRYLLGDLVRRVLDLSQGDRFVDSVFGRGPVRGGARRQRIRRDSRSRATGPAARTSTRTPPPGASG